jgi:hypothetical protein
MTNEQVLDALRPLIGTCYVVSVKACITELTGRNRVVGVGEISTKELDPNRINIVGDDNGRITGFHFG